MSTTTRYGFDLWTVDDNGEYVERIATGRALIHEVHRIARATAIDFGEIVAIVWDIEDP